MFNLSNGLLLIYTVVMYELFGFIFNDDIRKYRKKIDYNKDKKILEKLLLYTKSNNFDNNYYKKKYNICSDMLKKYNGEYIFTDIKYDFMFDIMFKIIPSSIAITGFMTTNEFMIDVFIFIFVVFVFTFLKLLSDIFLSEHMMSKSALLYQIHDIEQL